MSYTINPYSKLLKAVGDQCTLVHMKDFTVVMTKIPTLPSGPDMFLAKLAHGRSPSPEEVYHSLRYGIALVSTRVYYELTEIFRGNLFNECYNKANIRSMIFTSMVNRAVEVESEIVIYPLEEATISKRYTHVVQTQRDYLPLTKADTETDKIFDFISRHNKLVTC